MLAVVPARSGSRGVPDKALRTVAGVPLILRTLRTVEESGVANRIVVSTDCPRIKSFCELRGFEVIDRPPELAEDHVPVIEAARHVVETLGWTGTVGIFQPTCPLLRPATIQDVARTWAASSYDWAITAYSDPKIHWDAGGPLNARVQRQELGDVMCETGAAQFMLAKDGQIEVVGGRGVLPIPAREALDIDTLDDLLLAKRLLSLRRIHFVVLAPSKRTGTGHFHRSLALARRLSYHDVTWTWIGPPSAKEIEAVRAMGATSSPAPKADVTVFDRLGVPELHIREAQASGSKTVVLEDESSKGVADLTINALLDPAALPYADLREEFLHLPEREHREGADQVLVTFGGSDPARLGRRCFHLLRESGLSPLLVLPGEGEGVSMAADMRWADLVITSQGRTVFEAAASGTPCISIAANEREARHVRLPGVTYLGLHSTVPDEQIIQTVKATLADREMREEHARAAQAVIDGRGIDRLAHAIESLVQ